MEEDEEGAEEVVEVDDEEEKVGEEQEPKKKNKKGVFDINNKPFKYEINTQRINIFITKHLSHYLYLPKLKAPYWQLQV